MHMHGAQRELHALGELRKNDQEARRIHSARQTEDHVSSREERPAELAGDTRREIT